MRRSTAFATILSGCALVAWGCDAKKDEAPTSGGAAAGGATDEPSPKPAAVSEQGGEAKGEPAPVPGAKILAGCDMLKELEGEWAFRTQALGGRMAETVGAKGTFTMTVERKDCTAKATIRRQTGGLAFAKPKQFSGSKAQTATTELRFIGDDSGNDVLAYGYFELQSEDAKKAGKGPEVKNNFAFRPVDGKLYGYWTRAGDDLTILGTLNGVKGASAPETHAIADQPCEVQCMVACENLEHGEDSLQQADPAECVSGCRAGKVATCGEERDVPDAYKLEMAGPYPDEKAACAAMEKSMRAREDIEGGSIACSDRPEFRLMEEDRVGATPVTASGDEKWSKATIFWLYSQSGEGQELYFAGVQTPAGWYVSKDAVSSQGFRVPVDAAGTVDEMMAIEMFAAPLTDAPGDEFFAVLKSETGPQESSKRPRDDLAILCSVRDGAPACLRVPTRFGNASLHLTALPTGRISLRTQGGKFPGDPATGVFRWGG